MSLTLADLDQTQITLFDLPTAEPNRPFSPATWRIRYALNFKKISFTTYWLEMKDVQTIAPLIGGKATIKLPNGGVMYTVPIIYDPSTKKLITDSLPIAEYLDATYPSLPTLIPRGTEGLTRAFAHAMKKELSTLFPFIIPPTINILPEVSKEYFRTTREGFFKRKLEEVVPKGEDRVQQWAKVKETFDVFASWYEDEGDQGARKWISAEPTYPDLVIAAALMWVTRVLGDDSVEWKEIKEWHGGRWGKLLEDCRSYEGGY
ncbi:hypothetical protein BKA70DRAFT_1324011 [Coprinopsis sp. MPI-PUGE-AT-0042]|nr:hypothetical protein BKA70DRAFT_1324011 [Coprinopsis sp. MPI-PUGE-AT-0042]